VGKISGKAVASKRFINPSGSNQCSIKQRPLDKPAINPWLPGALFIAPRTAFEIRNGTCHRAQFGYTKKNLTSSFDNKTQAEGENKNIKFAT